MAKRTRPREGETSASTDRIRGVWSAGDRSLRESCAYELSMLFSSVMQTTVENANEVARTPLRLYLQCYKRHDFTLSRLGSKPNLRSLSSPHHITNDITDLTQAQYPCSAILTKSTINTVPSQPFILHQAIHTHTMHPNTQTLICSSHHHTHANKSPPTLTMPAKRKKKQPHSGDLNIRLHPCL
jgi:hypothetical protein